MNPLWYVIGAMSLLALAVAIVAHVLTRLYGDEEAKDDGNDDDWFFDIK